MIDDGWISTTGHGERAALTLVGMGAGLFAPLTIAQL